MTFRLRSSFALRLSLVTLGAGLLVMSAKSIIDFPGLLVGAILLSILPTLSAAFDSRCLDYDKGKMLLLIIIPLVVLHFLYFITMGVPVGFQDTHSNINYYENHLSETNHLSFSDNDALSYRFAGLFMTFKFIGESSSIQIVDMASIVPPITSLVVVILVYIFVARIHSLNVAVIAAILFGWESRVLILGQEMRTQTLGTLLILVLILLFVCTRLRPEGRPQRTSVIIPVVLFGIVISSFVSFLYACAIITAILIAPLVLSRAAQWHRGRLATSWRAFLLLLALFFCYVAYIGGGMSNILDALSILVDEISEAASSPTAEIGQASYGLFSRFITYAMWTIFIASSIWYVSVQREERNTDRIVFLSSFGLLLVITVVDSIVGILSVGRIYAVAFVVISTIIAFGALNDWSTRRLLPNRRMLRLTFLFLLVLIVLASVVRVPAYVVGDTIPLRGAEPIDTVPYWSSDAPQFAIDGFLFDHLQNHHLEYNSLIRNYLTLNLSFGDRNDPSASVIEDRFRGEYFTFRTLLPSLELYAEWNLVCSNGDYLVFLESS